MSRYDVDKFDPTPDPDLVCCICTCILDQPLVSPCQHVFCKVCIEKWLDRKKTCPTCRTQLVKDELRPVLPLVRNMLNRLTMICDYKHNGCDKVLNMEQFDAHIVECDFEMVTCRFESCLKSMLRKDIRQHEENDCDFKEENCPKCELSVQVRKMPLHDCIAALKNEIKGLDDTMKKLKDAYRASQEVNNDLLKKLEEARWHSLDDPWDSNTSWDSWDSHTDYSYSDDNNSSIMEDFSSPFGFYPQLPSDFDSNTFDSLGLNLNGNPVDHPSIEDLLPSIADTVRSQDETLSASENSDNSDRHSRRQNQRLVSERTHSDNTQNQSLLDGYTTLGSAVEEAFRSSAQSVLQNHYQQASTYDSSGSPSSARFPNDYALTNEQGRYECIPPSPPVFDQGATSSSASRHRNRLRSASLTEYSNRASDHYSRSYEASEYDRSESSKHDRRRIDLSDRSSERSFCSSTRLSEHYRRRSTSSENYRGRSRSSNHLTRSQSRSLERSILDSTGSRSSQYSVRSWLKSLNNSVKSQREHCDKSRSWLSDHSRSRSRSSNNSRSRSMSSNNSRSRSWSSRHSGKNIYRSADHSRSQSRSSNHSRNSPWSSRRSCRNVYRSTDHRRWSRFENSDTDCSDVSIQRKSQYSRRSGKRSHLSGDTSDTSNQPGSPSRLDYSGRSRSRSKHSDRHRSKSHYSSRSRSISEHSGWSRPVLSRHSRNSSKSRSSLTDRPRSRSKSLEHSVRSKVTLPSHLQSSDTEDSSTSASSRYSRKRLTIRKHLKTLESNSHSQNEPLKTKSKSRKSLKSSKGSNKSRSRHVYCSSPSDSTVVGSGHSSGLGHSVKKSSASSKQQSILPFLKKSSLSEPSRCHLKNSNSTNASKSTKKKMCNSVDTHSKCTSSIVNTVSTVNSGINFVKAPKNKGSSKHATTVKPTAEQDINVGNRIQNSLFTNSLVMQNNIELSISNPKKRKKVLNQDSVEQRKVKRMKASATDSGSTVSDSPKVNVKINLSLLNCTGAVQTNSCSTSVEHSRRESPHLRTSLSTSSKPSSDNDKISSQIKQICDEIQSDVDVPATDGRSVVFRNSTKQENTNAVSNTSRSYSFRKSTVEKITGQSLESHSETNTENLRRSSRRAVTSCNPSSLASLPSYWLADDSDPSWSPDRLAEQSDVSFSENDSTTTDSSYEVQVPKPLMQIIDEMVEDEDSDKSWTAADS